MKEYTYVMKARPVSINTQPKGFVRFTDDPLILNDRRYYGTVTYDRKLTKEEMDEYEMGRIY